MERKRILVVDDDPGATTLLQLYFEKSVTYEVKVENTSTRALATAEQFRPDLVFLDVDMPSMGGGEVANRLNKSPFFRGVPLVFLTATVSKEELLVRGGTIGGARFLAKPATRREVLDCVIEHLGIDAIRKRRMAAGSNGVPYPPSPKCDRGNSDTKQEAQF